MDPRVVALADEVAWAALIVSIAAAIPLYIDLIWRYASGNKVEFEIEKYYEANNGIVESLYVVRIARPNRVIKHCKVFYDNEPLPWQNSTRSRPNYDRKIGLGDGGNVRVPEAARLRNQNGLLVVKDGDKTLRKINFADIPRGHQ